MTVLEEALVCLAQEPWCFSPATIGQLTDRQIVEWYIRPAAARDRAAANLPPLPDPRAAVAPPPDQPPPRAAVVGVMRHVLGLSVAEANRRYDEQLAEWQSQRKQEGS
jgi:hypothetical protein